MSRNVTESALAVKKTQRFLQVPVELWLDSGLSDTAVRVYGILLNAKFEGQPVNIGVEKIAERLGRGRTKFAVMPALKRLKERGYIEIEKVGRHHQYELRGCATTTNGEEEPPVIGCDGTTDSGQPVAPGQGIGSRPATDNGSPEATLPIRRSLELITNDDVDGEKIKEERGEQKLRADADGFLKGMGATARQRRELLAKADLVMRWAEVDWERDYPDIRKPIGRLITAVRDGDEPILNTPATVIPWRGLWEEYVPKDVAGILKAAIRALKRNDRAPYYDAAWLEQNLVAAEKLASKGRSPDDVMAILEFAFQSMVTRGTHFEGIRTIGVLDACWDKLHELYVANTSEVALARTA